MSAENIASEANHRADLAEAIRATPKHGPKKRKGPLTPEERLEAMRKIVADKQCARVEGVLVDMTSAHLYVSIADKLNEQNREKLLSMKLSKGLQLCWQLAR